MGAPPAAGRGGPSVWSALRSAGPCVAWLAAVLCGSGLAARTDLLDAVLRAAVVWLAVLVLWLGGFAICDRVIGRALIDGKTEKDGTT